MSSSLHDHLVRVADLVDRPGASRRIDLRLAVPDDIDLPLTEVIEPLRLHGVLESVVDGILLRAILESTLAVECSRCLSGMREDVSTEVVELFAPAGEAFEEEDEPEAGYELDDGVLDLDTLLRDALIPAVPYQPLCREDCQGLCTICGADWNETTCDCVEPAGDSRWSALEGLVLPQDDGR